MLCALFVWFVGTHATPAASAARVAAGGLSGTVKGPDGQPLAGVAVYARGLGRTITTTVFTDDQGTYVFPPLEPGPYKLWAQAVGFDVARESVSLQPGRHDSKAFTLKTIADVSPQLYEAEWMAALPVSTREQRRMKEILRVNCGMCHSIAAVLQHRYDEAGWLAMVDQMAKYNRESRRPTVEYHKEELARYFASIRGPDSPRLPIKTLPRPRGAAASVVFTIYGVPLENTPDGLVIRDGTEWSQGRATHRG